MSQELENRLKFLENAEALKSTLRSAHLASGRVESTAEHTWRLCLWVLAFEDMLGDVDVLRLLKILLIHDLGEAISGDIPATQQDGSSDKTEQERADLVQIVAPLPQAWRCQIMALWEEYEAAETSEARLAKGLDKSETILQHNQGANPPDFDYAFNLDYGRAATDLAALPRALRPLLDAKTTARMA